MTTPSTPDGHAGIEHPLEAVDETELLALLTDDRCQAILEAVTDDTRTASELTDELDIPRSTLYRKIDSLTEANLLIEQTRIDANGNHESEYGRQFESVSLEVDFCGGLEITVEDGEPVAAGAHTTISVGAD